MYYIDYHTHPLSHGEDEVKPFHNIELLMKFIRKAEEKGIEELGFSDHNQFIYNYNWDNLLDVKENSDISLKFGLEMDYIPGKESEIKKTIKKNCFDYVIGSVHEIDGWIFDHPRYKDNYKNWDIEDLYRAYFRNIESLIESDLFDIVGHLDLIKIFGYKISDSKLKQVVDPVLKIIKGHDIAVEINTNGLNKPVKEIYPSYKILKKMVDLNIPITFGSDAHRPKRVGENIKKVYKMLTDLGCNKVATFEKRKMNYVNII